MDLKYTVADLKTALSQQLFPTVTVWNRLEGRPRQNDFARALRAEVRDPLWMLTKQWQLGEFQADDTGSPVFAKLRMRTAPVTKYQPAGGVTEPLEPNIPLEVKVEQRPVQFQWNGQKMRFDLRAQLGRQWSNMLRASGLVAYIPKYLERYAITLPPEEETSDYIYAHRQAWQQYAALAGRAIDGGDLHLFLSSDAAHFASSGIALDAPGDGDRLDALGVEFEAWFKTMYYEPAQDAAWKPPYLEYQMACSVPRQGGEQVLAADEYASGQLDWYSFDRARGALGGPPDPGEQTTVSSFIPTPVTFEGMPDPRWWALEDRKTDFGAVNPSTTDLAQLLLMEFSLVYANDWFLFPHKLPAGTLARIDGLAVTNNFGERFWIPGAGTGPQDNWHRWAMFQLSSHDPARSLGDPSMFIAPVVAATIDGSPLEEIELARDEVANMAWAIERTLPSLTGAGRAGKDEGRETRAFHERLIAAIATPPPPFQAGVAYLAMTNVPEHFIPFIPVHVPGSVREIELQRSRMLRIVDGDPLPPDKIPPRTTLVREGLDLTVKRPYFVHEEEVPRAGILVTESFRRTRWTKGEAYVWLGVRKETGRGERSSGLAFDSLVNAKAQSR